MFYVIKHFMLQNITYFMLQNILCFVSQTTISVTKKLLVILKKSIDTTTQTAIMNNISYPRESRTYETLCSN